MKIKAIILATSLGLTSVSFGQNAEIKKQVSVDECSESLYINLSIYASAGDSACSHGRTDSDFQNCTIRLTREIGDDHVDIAGRACAKMKSYEEAQCATDLYLKGGLYVYNYDLAYDGQRVCSRHESRDIKKCIIDAYQSLKASGQEAAKKCVEKFDPVARARREAEIRRIAEEKARIEADRQKVEAEKKKQEEARKKAEEENRKKEEARKKAEEDKKKAEPPKSDSGGGVIVDLPNL